MTVSRLAFARFRRALPACHLRIDAEILAGNQVAADAAAFRSGDMRILGGSELGYVRSRNGGNDLRGDFRLVRHDARQLTIQLQAKPMELPQKMRGRKRIPSAHFLPPVSFG